MDYNYLCGDIVMNDISLRDINNSNINTEWTLESNYKSSLEYSKIPTAGCLQRRVNGQITRRLY